MDSMSSRFIAYAITGPRHATWARVEEHLSSHTSNRSFHLLAAQREHCGIQI